LFCAVSGVVVCCCWRLAFKTNNHDHNNKQASQLSKRPNVSSLKLETQSRTGHHRHQHQEEDALDRHCVCCFLGGGTTRAGLCTCG
jgi:hypothetical protein